MINFFFLLFLNFLFFKNYLFISKKYNLYDYPDNLRKKHKEPTPLLGGLLIFLNLIFYTFLECGEFFSLNYFSTNKELFIFFFISSGFYFLGYYDDKFHLRANYKLMIISLLIFIAMFFDDSLVIKYIDFSFIDFRLEFFSFSYFITILCFLLFINSFNMLDGINGQATSYSLFVIILFIILKVNIFLFLCLLTSLLFFLYYNFKGKMFLGDSGTLLLGFILSYFFVKSSNVLSILYSDEIFLIMMIPGLELLRLAFTRLIKKKHPFKPDNNHIHHYMIDKFGYLKSYLSIQLLLMMPYLAFLIFSNSIASFIISFIIYSLILIFVQKKN
jgi:UDP-GlcNAc:undecaprenyl-phosphate/decaprenyl-phosphate GlcNAc-1-phosphate transferase